MLRYFVVGSLISIYACIQITRLPTSPKGIPWEPMKAHRIHVYEWFVGHVSMF